MYIHVYSIHSQRLVSVFSLHFVCLFPLLLCAIFLPPFFFKTTLKVFEFFSLCARTTWTLFTGYSMNVKCKTFDFLNSRKCYESLEQIWDWLTNLLAEWLADWRDAYYKTGCPSVYPAVCLLQGSEQLKQSCMKFKTFNHLFYLGPKFTKA